jgi:hypothetical protein
MNCFPGEKSLELEAKRLAPPDPGKARAVLMMPADEVIGLPKFVRFVPPAVASKRATAWLIHLVVSIEIG